MKKTTFVIHRLRGFESVEGYITEDGEYGIDKREDGKWHVTDIATGLGVNGSYETRKSAIADIARVSAIVCKYRNTERYANAVKEINEFKGGKEMATNTTTKAKRNNYKAENEALKKELEILKKQIEELTRVEKTTLDTFDVESYMNSRDNMHRITPELVEAISNTKGLKFVFRNSSKEVVPFSGTEWIYVSGETEADTKDRKDIFKAMSFKWSAPEKAWVLAPYPIRSKKAWGAKKARKAMATA